MGKIFNALEKYRSERSAPAGPVAPLQREDLVALLQFNRHTGKLNLNARSVIRDPGTVQRLIGHQLILEDGRVTEEGRAKCEKLTYQLRVSLAGQPEKHPIATGAKDKTDTVQSPSDLHEPLGPLAATPPAQTPKRVASDSSVLESDIGKAPVLEDRKPAPPAVEPAARQAPAHKGTVKSSGTVSAIDPNLVSLLAPHSFESEQFKILRTNLLFPVSGAPPRSVLVTSVHPGDGKSFVAANLAVSVALNINRYVLLVDADLRKPTIHTQFGFGDVPGLSEYLSKGVSLPSLLLPTKIDRLTILPGGESPPNPAELLSCDRMSALVEEITNRYKDRLIIIDSPPPTLTAETSVLARMAEGIILVVRYAKTGRDEFEKLADNMDRKKIVGCVLNHYDHRSIGLSGYRDYRNYGGYKQ